MTANALLAALLLTVPLGGCLFGSDPTFSDPLIDYGFAVPADVGPGTPLAASAIDWPDFTGATLKILDHGAFGAFDAAAARFEQLTGAKVTHTAADDTGGAVTRAEAGRGDPEFDILYGVDNMLLHRALGRPTAEQLRTGDLKNSLLAPYTPQLAGRVAPELVFFGPMEWPATPVDHGYIAINIDAEYDQEIVTLHDLITHAGDFVTQDPNKSTPGLGFFLTTVGRFGSTGDMTWQQYWAALLAGKDGNSTSGDEVLVAPDWSTAYEIHYSGGYGVFESGHEGDRAIVTSYTESPAYEWYWDEVHPRRTGEYEPGGHYESDPDNLPRVLLDDGGSVYHQIQTMGILKGTKNLAVAQAWIEFTLTDDFQALAAPKNAVYPVVRSVSVEDTYSGLDPDPATLPIVELDWLHVGLNLESWLASWTQLCEARNCR